MKKTSVLFLILICLLNTSCNTKNQKSDLEIENLKGNIISVHTTDYNVSEKFGEPVKGSKKCVELEVCETITKFNDLGLETEFTEFDSFGITFISKYVFNEKNQKTELNRYNEDGERKMQFKYKYDSIGNCIQVISDAGYVEKKVFDKKNRLVKQNIKMDTWSENETTFSYNDKGLVIKEAYPNGYTTNTYFDNNDLKEITYFNKNGSINAKGNYTYKYDNHNNWIVRVGYQNGKAVSYNERIIEYKD